MKKLKKKTKLTTDGRIKAALRRLWMYSTERSIALKREEYCCEICGVKQSVAKANPVKVHVHHKTMIDWKKIYKYLRKTLLCDSSELQVLCIPCHKEVHDALKEGE